MELDLGSAREYWASKGRPAPVALAGDFAFIIAHIYYATFPLWGGAILFLILYILMPC